MKGLVAWATTLAIAGTLCACGGAGTGTLSDMIDSETGAYEVTADNAGKDSSAGSLGGLTLTEGQSLVVDSALKEGSLSLRITDSVGNVALEESIEGTSCELFGFGYGEYSLGVTCAEDGTTGTMTVVAVDDDVYFENEENLEATLDEMGRWTKVRTAEEAAQGVGFEEFVLPGEGSTLNVGTVGPWSIKYEQARIQARGSAGACGLKVIKAVYVGDGDASNDERDYSFEWATDIDGTEVRCTGNVEGQTKRALWIKGDYMYALLCEGQGDERDSFGLSAEDVATLVRAIR